MFDRNLQGLRGAVALAVAAALVAGGCTYSSLVGVPGPAEPGTARYESDARQASLEVPPDLSRAGVRDAYPIPGAGAGGSGAASVLPEIPGMRVERDGLVRWLVVEAEPGDLWPGLREFWLRQGFSLEVDDPQVGVMETGWAEERVPLPVGGIRRALERVKRFAYTYAVRDRFRTRVERSEESGATEIHVTHRGAHEVVRGDGYAWAPRPSDPALEVEMLGRLMLHLGRDEAPGAGTAVAADVGEPRAEVMDDPAGGKYIQLEGDFDRGWRLVRRALDRGGSRWSTSTGATATFSCDTTMSTRPTTGSGAGSGASRSGAIGTAVGRSGTPSAESCSSDSMRRPPASWCRTPTAGATRAGLRLGSSPFSRSTSSSRAPGTLLSRPWRCPARHSAGSAPASGVPDEALAAASLSRR